MIIFGFLNNIINSCSLNEFFDIFPSLNKWIKLLFKLIIIILFKLFLWFECLITFCIYSSVNTNIEWISKKVIPRDFRIFDRVCIN